MIVQVGGSTVEAKLDVSTTLPALCSCCYSVCVCVRVCVCVCVTVRVCVSLYVLQSCVADLGSSAASFKELRETAITSVCETLLLPKFQPLVDVFSSYNHVLSEVCSTVSSKELYFIYF